MLTAHIHPRLGINKFTQFEPFFLEGLEALARDGSATIFTIDGGLSPSTIAARMRDSLQGYRLNKQVWKDRVSPRFVELMEMLDGQFVIAGPDNAGRVMMRLRSIPKNFHGTLFNEAAGNLPKYIRTTHVKPSDINIVQPSSIASRAPNCEEDTVRAFVLLKSQGFDQPVVFPGPVNPELIVSLTGSADLAFHYDSERNETVLM